jgi:hypothetical protein
MIRMMMMTMMMMIRIMMMMTPAPPRIVCLVDGARFLYLVFICILHSSNMIVRVLVHATVFVLVRVHAPVCVFVLGLVDGPVCVFHASACSQVNPFEVEITKHTIEITIMMQYTQHTAYRWTVEQTVI